MKIQPQELRIGNLIYNPYDEITDVTLDILVYLEKCKRDKQEPYNYKPIPITEDILLKAGFDHNNGEWYGLTYCGDVWITVGVNQRVIDLYSQDDDVDPVRVRRKFTVHQLQNLYYALTGEELTINLKDKPTP